MALSSLAGEILTFFRDTGPVSGARVTVAKLDARYGTDPAVSVAILELKQLGYVIVPDPATVELTDRGADKLNEGPV